MPDNPIELLQNKAILYIILLSNTFQIVLYFPQHLFLIYPVCKPSLRGIVVNNNKTNLKNCTTEPAVFEPKTFRFGPAIPMPRKTKVGVLYQEKKEPRADLTLFWLF